MKLLGAMYWTAPSGRVYRPRILTVLAFGFLVIAVERPFVHPLIVSLRRLGLDRPTMALIIVLGCIAGYLVLLLLLSLLARAKWTRRSVPRWLARMTMVEVKSTKVS